jgi:hypothetical protein
MKRISAPSWASKLVESLGNDAFNGEDTVLALTVDEADLLEPPPHAAYQPWVVPLTFRPNDAAYETADDD